jgi:iron complex outermembrane receptor protein
MKPKTLAESLIIAGGLAASLGIGWTTAFAADAGAEAATDTGPGALEEITITARRREESAQSVPVSVTALSGDALQVHSATDLQSLTSLTPGLRYGAEGGGQNTTISLRGLSKIPVGDGTPAVVTYFANVPMGSTGLNIPTFDLANIQVLKGPQGTLFGRNTVGGAILVTPQAPTYGTDGYVKVGFGDYHSETAEGAVNIPLVADKLALRVAGQIRLRDGFQENVGLGPDLDNLHQHAFRASLLWDPAPGISNTLVWDYFLATERPSNAVFFRYSPGVLTNFGGPAAVPLFGPFESSLAQAFAAQQARGPLTVDSGEPVLATNRRLWGVSNTTSFNLPANITLRNIFGYRVTETDTMADPPGVPILQADASAVPLAALGIPAPGTLDRLAILNAGQVVKKKQVTDEIQLLGTSFNDRLNWILGGFYLKDQPNGGQGSWFQQFDIYSSLTGIQLSPAAASTALVTNKSYSGFAQVALDLSPWVLQGLKLNLGGRYTKDEVSACGATVVGGTSSLDAPYLTESQCASNGATHPGTGAGTLQTSSSAPSWTVGLDYRITDETFVYVTGRRGYRAGGVNTPIFNTPGTTTNGPGAVDIRPYQYIKPEKVEDVEVGEKSDLEIGDIPLRINLDLFHMKYSDAVQFINVVCCISTTDPGLPLNGSFGFNAGNLTIQGGEFEAAAQPVRGLTLTTSAAYTHQKVNSIASIPSPFTLTPSQVTLPTPVWSATFGFNWILPGRLFDGNLALIGDYFWTDKWQSQGYSIAGYDTTNFRLNWTTGTNRNLVVGLYVTNAFDKEYVASAAVVLPGFPIGGAIYGPPRMYGVDAVYHFGK